MEAWYSCKILQVSICGCTCSMHIQSNRTAPDRWNDKAGCRSISASPCLRGDGLRASEREEGASSAVGMDEHGAEEERQQARYLVRPHLSEVDGRIGLPMMMLRESNDKRMSMQKFVLSRPE